MAKPATAAAERRPVAKPADAKPSDPSRPIVHRELIGLGLLGAAVGFGAALFSFSPQDMEIIQSGRSGEGVANLIGPVGARIADILLQVLGLGAFALDGLLLLLAVRTLAGWTTAPRPRTALGIAGMTLAGLLLLHLSAQSANIRPFGKDAAGLVPGAVAVLCKALLSTVGTVLLATLLLAASAAAITGRSLVGGAIRWLTGRATPAVHGVAGAGAEAARSGWSSLLARMRRQRCAELEAYDEDESEMAFSVADLQAAPAPRADVARQDTPRQEAIRPSTVRTQAVRAETGSKPEPSPRVEAVLLNDTAVVRPPPPAPRGPAPVDLSLVRDDAMTPPADQIPSSVRRARARAESESPLAASEIALDRDAASLSGPGVRVRLPVPPPGEVLFAPQTAELPVLPDEALIDDAPLWHPEAVFAAADLPDASQPRATAGITSPLAWNPPALAPQAPRLSEPLPASLQHTAQNRLRMTEPVSGLTSAPVHAARHEAAVASVVNTAQMRVAEVKRAHEDLAMLEAIGADARDETPLRPIAVHPVEFDVDEDLLPPPVPQVLPVEARGPRIVETEALRNTPVRVPAQAMQIDLGLGGRRWVTPPSSLLQQPPTRVVDYDTKVLHENAAVLQQKLAEFNIQGEVTDIRPGPVVTTYEYRPAPGIKISKIVNLRDDLTMSLSALRVRIVAPIPGRDVVGIEVPNHQRQMVFFRELVESEVFQGAPGPLTLILGKDIEGKPLCTDLARAPHMLVAGATGTGKSVGINSFICSMLYRATPDQVKFIFIDPKILELSIYEGIPHLLLPVLDEPRKAELALKWACVEMDRRYRLLSEAGVRNLAGYKDKLPDLKLAAMRRKAEQERADLDGNVGTEVIEIPEDMPYIVVVIDEFADLIMAAGKEVEIPVARLAQKARAAGIHVILATQRPSVDVITGMIKANFPTRVSFQVASAMDSKVVLTSTGAETLLGKGDMLFIPPGEGHLRRCHGTWITDDEVAAIAEHWKRQGAPKYDLAILRDPEVEAATDQDDAELDPLYDEAVRMAVDANQASVSFLQRKLGIGYGRSARIVDTMESRGIVGPSRGPNKPREILVNQL